MSFYLFFKLSCSFFLVFSFTLSILEDLLLSFGEEEFVSIATGQKQLIAKAPAVASVITAEDLKSRA